LFARNGAQVNCAPFLRLGGPDGGSIGVLDFREDGGVLVYGCWLLAGVE
jgi:hypothetical protein